MVFGARRHPPAGLTKKCERMNGCECSYEFHSDISSSCDIILGGGAHSIFTTDSTRCMNIEKNLETSADRSYRTSPCIGDLLDVGMLQYYRISIMYLFLWREFVKNEKFH